MCPGPAPSFSNPQYPICQPRGMDSGKAKASALWEQDLRIRHSLTAQKPLPGTSFPLTGPDEGGSAELYTGLKAIKEQQPHRKGLLSTWQVQALC